MKPEIVKFNRKFNIGNYQTIDAGVEASVEDGETVEEALKKLEQSVMAWWHGRESSKLADQIGDV